MLVVIGADASQSLHYAPTAAVRPTPEEPRPVVEMARREVLRMALR
jgi:hypothetical protein